MIPTHEILTNAARLIEEHGWTQGAFFVPREGLCILGSILSAICGRETACDHDGVIGSGTWVAACRYLRNDSMAFWNDQLPRDTGKATVLAALRHAAARAKADYDKAHAEAPTETREEEMVNA